MHELTSDADRARITELYQEGQSAPTISAMTGVPVHRVRTVLKEAGLLQRGGTRSSEDQMWPKIEALLAEGRSIKSISDETGIPYQTTLRWCQNKGVDTKGAQKTAQLKQRACVLAGQKLTLAEIAQQIDTPARTVARWLAAEGVSTNGQKGSPPVKKERYLARAVELHGTGKTVYEIAHEIGDVHFGTVIAWLQGEGLKPYYGRTEVERQSKNKPDPLNDSRRAEAVRRYLAGEAATTIDKSLKVAQGTTELWARRDGVWEQGGKFKRRKERGERARTLFGEGKSLSAIAAALGTDYYSAKQILAEEGLIEDDGTAGQICLCGADTGSPNRKYCSPEHRSQYQIKRQADPANHVTITCQNEKCGKQIERYKKYGKGHLKYCSNECARTHTKTRKFYAVEGLEIIFESSWECLFWSLCTFRKIPIERFEREHGIAWGDDGWYAPDFWLPGLNLAVEIKGQEDDEDRAKWAAFPGRLVVLNHASLEFMCGSVDMEHDLMEFSTV